MLRLPSTLCHHGGEQDTVNHWVVTPANQEAITGTLVKKGFRSAGLLILVLHDSNLRRNVRVPVWQDSVSDQQYSYLNLQLMFNTDKD